MTLVEFLLARIAEDEDDACPCCDEGPGSISYHLAREVEAKRQLVAHFAPYLAYADPPNHDAWFTLMTLAAVYSDHPDYRDDWRP